MSTFLNAYGEIFEQVKGTINAINRNDHGRTKYGMATLFQIDQATFICRQ